MRSLAFLCGAILGLLFGMPPVLSLDRDAAHSIGRLNYAGYKKRQHCTAFLVAPKIAMTAAHCIEGLQPPDVHLLLGYDRGSWREHLRPSHFWRSPDGEDLAALCLAQPAGAEPLTLRASTAEQNQQLSVLGYGLPGVHRVSRKNCRVKAISPRGALVLDCPVTKGTSGGPVLTEQLSSLLAVMSATTKRESLAISIPPLDLTKICS